MNNDPSPSAGDLIIDEGYKIGTTEQAEALGTYKGTRTPAPEPLITITDGPVVSNVAVQEMIRETRRRLVLEAAEEMYKAESGSIIRPRPFDKTDVACQSYIRMAEAAFEIYLGRTLRLQGKL